MAFAAAHYLMQWWWSKRETALLGFSILCAMAGFLTHAVANEAMATTAAATESALDQRTTIVLLAYPLLAWLVSRVGDVQAPRFVGVVTVALGGAALLSLMGVPSSGTAWAVPRFLVLLPVPL